MWRKFLRGVGCLSYLGGLVAIFGLVAYFAFSLFVRGGVTKTPELQGMDEKEAEAMLTDQGLLLVWSEEDNRYHDEVPKGHILMQRPRAGTLVKRGRTVTVVVSRGPRLIAVPEVTGEALQAAQVTLAAAGLRLGRTVTVLSERPNGTVVAQKPAAGIRAERDAAVDLFLSLEDTRQAFLMPDLAYHSYDEVRRFFQRRGFRFGRVSYSPYEGTAPGTVLRQFPLAGHPLHRDDRIALVVVPSETPKGSPGSAPPGSGPPGAVSPGSGLPGSGPTGSGPSGGEPAP